MISSSTLIVCITLLGLPVDLIEKMLERDVAKRLTIHQVMEHPWLAQISVDP
jgi:serine/threonine protein kinase